MSDELTPTIGLEVHTQLATERKLFCGCQIDHDAEANTRTCPTCLGLPGSLPRLNERAVEKAIAAGKAIDADIAERAHFDRKHYFYPDLPKGFQITQYEHPLCTTGHIDLDDRRVRIRRAHLEEDPGRLSYGDKNISTADETHIDYNRAGVPLVEFVTEPDLTTPAEARAFVDELQTRLVYLDIIDPQRAGSLRVDANISLSSADVTGSRVEVKNIGSISAVEDALAYEVTRQRDRLRKQGELSSTTRHWDASRGVTVKLREKESEADYRYFREYDLPSLSFSQT